MVLDVFDEVLGRRGALQAVTLRDIRTTLMALGQLSTETTLDVERVHALLDALSRVFKDLTENTRSFMAGLGRSSDLRGAERDIVVAYKEKRVLDYLNRFVGDLAVLSPHIFRLIHSSCTLKRAGI